jgi:hypothetical protein
VYETEYRNCDQYSREPKPTPPIRKATPTISFELQGSTQHTTKMVTPNNACVRRDDALRLITTRLFSFLSMV